MKNAIKSVALVAALLAGSIYITACNKSKNMENANAEQGQQAASAVPSTATTPTATPNASTETTNTTSDFIMKGSRLESYIGTSENVTIPNGVTIIGMGAFWRNHERLTSVTIPNIRKTARFT